MRFFKLKLTFSSTLLLLCLSGVAQKMPEDYFREGNAFAEEGKDSLSLVQAVKCYKYITDSITPGDFYPEALFNLGIVYTRLKDEGRAIHAFGRVLYGDSDDRKEVGEDIMSSPYANYKHFASEALSGLYRDRKDYWAALHYLALSDTVYPYQHFCGNAYESCYNSLAVAYADLYGNLHDTTRMYTVLLGRVMNGELASNTDVIEHIRLLLSIRADKYGLKDVLEKSLGDIRKKEVKSGKEKNLVYYFRFLNTDVPIRNVYKYENKYSYPSIPELASFVRKSAFYQMVRSL